MRRVIVVAWLTTLWLVLWRDLSVANVLSGLGLAMLADLTRPWRPAERHDNTVRPVALLRFLGYFLWKLLESNIVLAREVLTPRNSIETGVIEVPLDTRSELVVAIVANAISLTPGTLTLEVRRTDVPILYVHVLHLHDIEVARRDVKLLAAKANAAFPSTAPAEEDAS